MQPFIRAAIARIDVMQQDRSISRGTGFLVAEGLVLTALHVVADRTKEARTPYPGEIVFTFPGHTTKAVIHESYFDRMADWALLKCETAPPVRPIPLAEAPKDGAAWETYGFPDANPRDGMVNIGEVSNCLGTLDGNAVFQLFSREAAAGQGAPVKGLSGSPVIVDNAVAGILRFALMKDQQTVAGTVYACPIASVLQKAAELLPTPDPCAGLPGLPRQPLPAEPFRYLAWFTVKEAEVFFGRNREIRETYHRLTADDAPPVTLLYGQSGVGKSSFLDAGLLPRLRWYHDVRYVRRDARSSLVETLRETLQGEWKVVEENAGKPVIVFFDQIEEIYTRPNEQHPNELAELFTEIKRVFEGTHVPRGRLVLAFRKEWFPEVQKQMELAGLPYGKVFMEGLDRAAIMEVVTGLTQTERLRQFYGLSVEARLPGVIADALVADSGSPIAPTLQILLTKMWRKTAAENHHAPHFTKELYESLLASGHILGDFLDEQIQALKATRVEWVESGLALDVLALHTTPLLTAKDCTSSQLLESYRDRQDQIPILLRELQTLFLLSDSSSNSERRATRLAHDTLAPLVRERFDESENPGQRARRILENRVKELTEGGVRDGSSTRDKGETPEERAFRMLETRIKDGSADLLDDGSLKVVHNGKVGMRALTGLEETLVTASEIQNRRRHRNRWILRGTGVAAVIAIAITAVFALIARRDAAIQRDEASLQLRIVQANQVLDTDPARAMVLAVAALQRSGVQRGDVLPAIQGVLSATLSRVREENRFQTTGGVWVDRNTLTDEGLVPALDWSADGIIATLGGEERDVDSIKNEAVIELWDPGAKQNPVRIPLNLDSLGFSLYPHVTFSPDGKKLALWGDGGVHLLDRQGRSLGKTFGGPVSEVLSLAFAPDGTLVTGSSDGFLRSWSPEGEKRWEAEAQIGGRYRVKVVVVTTSPDKTPLIISADSGGVVRGWTLAGQASGEPYASQEAINSLAILARDDEPWAMATSSLYSDDVLITGWNKRRGGFSIRDQGKSSARLLPGNEKSSDVCAVALSPTRNLLAVSVRDEGAVRFVNLDGAEEFPPFRHQRAGSCAALSFDPSGDHLAVRAPEGEMYIVDTKRDVLSRSLVAGTAPLLRQQFSSNGAFLIAVDFDGIVYVWDLRKPQEKPISKISLDASERNFLFNGLAITAEGTRIAASTGDGTVRLWNTGGTLVTKFENPGTRSYGLAFSNDGRSLMSVQAAKGAPYVMVWDLRGGHRLWPAEPSEKDPSLDQSWSSIAFSPDGTRVARATAAKSIEIFNIDGTRAAASLKTDVYLRRLVFSSDGKRLVGTADQKTVYSWDLETGRTFSSKPTISEFLGLAAVEGNVFLGIGPNLTIADAASGEIIATLSKTASSAVASPDGKLVATTGENGIVRLWPANWADWLEGICQRLRTHPILTDPKSSAGIDPEDLEYARQACYK